MAVPRFFFHVRDSTEIIDRVGTECTGREDARAQAVRAAGDMLKELGGRFWDDEQWRMSVTDEAGAAVCAARNPPSRIALATARQSGLPKKSLSRRCRCFG